MRILALETTDKTGGIAALDDANVLAHRELNPAQRSAQSLLPGIRDLLVTVGWRPEEIEMIAVAIGPGSFTGLRVGIVAAKTLAYATGAQVMGVNTLEVIAGQASAQDIDPIHVVMDGQRGQVFVGQFRRSTTGEVSRIDESRLMNDTDWLAQIASDHSCHVTGPARARLGDRFPSGVRVVDRLLWKPTAAAVGQLAFREFGQGRRDDLWKLAPLYFRQSAAEEKRIRQQSEATGADQPPVC